MTTKEFIESLGISVDSNPFTVEGSTYTLKMDNSTDFMNLYSILEHSDDIELYDESVEVNENSSKMTYVSEDFDIILTADYDNDEYVLTVKEF